MQAAKLTSMRAQIKALQAELETAKEVVASQHELLNDKVFARCVPQLSRTRCRSGVPHTGNHVWILWQPWRATAEGRRVSRHCGIPGAA